MGLYFAPYGRGAPYECISKGKARKPYEFGVKVSLAVAHKSGLIVGARSLPGNPFDGHTLSAQLEQTGVLLQDLGIKPKVAVVDLGYRGADSDIAPVELIHRGKYKSLTVTSCRSSTCCARPACGSDHGAGRPAPGRNSHKGNDMWLFFVEITTKNRQATAMKPATLRRPIKHVPVLVQGSAQRLGQRLVLARKMREMTQEQLATLSDVSLSTLRGLEAGADGVSIGNLLKVLKGLNLLEQADQLLDPRHDPETVLFAQRIVQGGAGRR